MLNTINGQGDFQGINGRDQGVCKSNQLHVGILKFSFIKLGYIPWLPEYKNILVFSNFGHVLLAIFIRTYNFFFVLVNTHHQNILHTLEVQKICMYVKDSWNKYNIFYVLR